MLDVSSCLDGSGTFSITKNMRSKPYALAPLACRLIVTYVITVLAATGLGSTALVLAVVSGALGVATAALSLVAGWSLQTAVVRILVLRMEPIWKNDDELRIPCGR